MTAIRIVDVTDEAALPADPAVRRPGIRPPHVRLLGGRRSRVEGGPPRLARGLARRPPPPRPAVADNPFIPRAGSRRSTRSRLRRAPAAAFDPFADDEADVPVENPFAPRPAGPAGGRRRCPAEARPARPRAGGLRELRQGPPGRRGRRRVRPVRAALRLPAGPAPARPLPAAARRAAARRHHLHRDDRGGSRRGPRQRADPRGLRRSRGSRLRGRRGVPGAWNPAGCHERGHPGVLGRSGFAVVVEDERFPVVRRELS